jgi:hypothetical protein
VRACVWVGAGIRTRLHVHTRSHARSYARSYDHATPKNKTELHTIWSHPSLRPTQRSQSGHCCANSLNAFSNSGSAWSNSAKEDTQALVRLVQIVFVFQASIDRRLQNSSPTRTERKHGRSRKQGREGEKSARVKSKTTGIVRRKQRKAYCNFCCPDREVPPL